MQVSQAKSVIIAALLLLIAVSPGQAQGPDASSIQAIEQQLHKLTNEQRKQHGLSELRTEPILCEAARNHSAEMISLDYFEHDSPTPGMVHPWDRIFRMGVKSRRVTENIFRPTAIRWPKLRPSASRTG